MRLTPDMELHSLLSANKEAIVLKWLSLVLDSYPADTSSFLKTNKNQFANPVGYTLEQGLQGIFEGLVSGQELNSLSGHLDGIVRVRAVQGIDASQALSFVFLLKPIIRELVNTASAEAPDQDALAAFEQRIDALALIAFDLYMKCREKIYALMAEESKRMTFRLLQRAQLLTEGGQ